MIGYTPPVREIGDTRVSATEDFGAIGDGKSDCTPAINNAFLALMKGGGEVHITKPGDYLVDISKSIRPVNNSRLRLEQGVRLVPSISTLQRGYLLLVKDIHDFELIGGELVGDRANFSIPSTPGNTYEWRHGIACYASDNCSFLDVTTRNWVGDGISIGGSKPSNDIVIHRMLSTNNRRQGCSITNADGVYIRDSEFSFTNGTDPQCGIDIEPEKTELVNDVTIHTCVLGDNAKYGMHVLRRAGCGPVTGVDIINCQTRRNSNGIALTGVQDITIEGGSVDHNRATGILIAPGTRNVSIGMPLTGTPDQMVSFQRNYTKNADRVRKTMVVSGWNSGLDRDILIQKDTLDIRVLTNKYLAT